MTKYLMLVALVAALPKTIWSIDADCDYKQDVVAGEKYYINNPEHPSYYSGARSCVWSLGGATNLRLSCEVTLPTTADCTGDRISVSPSGNPQLTDAQNYCGTRSFNITSTGNNLNIVFTALRGTTGGRFLCTVEENTVTTPTCSCGWKNSDLGIVGGNETGVHEYPMMAGVVNINHRTVDCGGTIIAPKYVLTAAHCRLQFNDIRNQVGILVGDWDISNGTDTNSSVLHRVSSWVNYPSHNNSGEVNDIAVITVADTIVFTMQVGPTCLPFQAASSTFVGSKVTALGWGTLSFGGPRSKVLQKVELDVITASQCQDKYPGVTTNQLCTYTPGKDSCQYDSGGPLLQLNPNTGRLVSAAVISYGGPCAGSVPSINTRIGPYIDWIISVTPGADYCRLE